MTFSLLYLTFQTLLTVQRVQLSYFWPVNVWQLRWQACDVDDTLRWHYTSNFTCFEVLKRLNAEVFFKQLLKFFRFSTEMNRSPRLTSGRVTANLLRLILDKVTIHDYRSNFSI